MGNNVYFGDERSHATSSASGCAHPWDKYSLMVNSLVGLSVQADPNRYNPSSCGHLMNDSRGTGLKSNAVILHMFGGMLIVVQATEDLVAGEELLSSYGEIYWEKAENTCDAEVEAITRMA
jgi:hypothetical protein